jgi:xanthine dehydrogenase accessory factor
VRGAGSGGGTALVKGGGEVGTAVAVALWRAGWRVVAAELARPTTLRRQLSAAEAAFAGPVERDGVEIALAADLAALTALLAAGSALPLYVGPLAPALAALRPTLVVDARLQRPALAEAQRGEARLVIGLGPGLAAGEHVDAAIETCPGPDLGEIIWQGAARPHVPLRRAASTERFVYAPGPGLWRSERAIGEDVTAGDALGTVDGAPLLAPAAGALRGLVHDAVPVPAGLKVAAIHAGDWRRKESGICERAAALAASVLAAVEQARLLRVDGA